MIDQEGKDSQMNMHERVRVRVQGFKVDYFIKLFSVVPFQSLFLMHECLRPSSKS